METELKVCRSTQSEGKWCCTYKYLYIALTIILDNDDILEEVETELKSHGRLHASLVKPQFLTMMVIFITIVAFIF